MEHSPFVTTMPEMPEVETVRRGLEPHWVGRRISFVDLRRPDLRFPFPDGFDEGLTGATVEGIGRASKYLLIRLDNGLTWLSHLGMTGFGLSMQMEKASMTTCMLNSTMVR